MDNFTSSSSPNMKRTVDVHCKCGAYLGRVVPGYTKTIQCFCGEVIAVPKPSAEDLEDDYDCKPLPTLA